MLHVCGNVAHIFPKLIEFNVDVLEHEFAAHPEQLEVIKEYDFPQVLGYGCVRSDSERVEDVGEIVRAIQCAVEFFGKGKLMINPDCGLRHLSENAAYRKLLNMVRARDEVMADG